MRGELPLCEFCRINHVKLRKHKTCSPSCGAALRWQNEDAKARIDRERARDNGRKNWMSQRLAIEFNQWAAKFGIPKTETAFRAYVNARTKGYLTGYAAYYQRRRSKMIKAILHEDTAHTNTAR